MTSIFSSLLVNGIFINSQMWLGVAYAVLAVCVLVLLVNTKWREENKKGGRN